MMTDSLAVITGAAGDIGHAIACELLTHGYHVAATDIDIAGLRNREDQLAGSDGYHALKLDVCDPQSVDKAFTTIAQRLGPVTALVNNAGAISAHNLKTTSEDQWTHDIALNLTGAWRCINAVMDVMIAKAEGSIINIASVNGIGIYGHPGYSVAKAGLIHLTRFAAVELGPHNIQTNAICPGTVKTKAWEQRTRHYPEIIADAMQWYPSRDVCEPADIANLVAFLLTKAPKTMNGAIIPTDGGLIAGQDIVASAFCGKPF